MTKRGKNFLTGLVVFLIVTAAVLVVLNVLFGVEPVKGKSMDPTVLSGDRVVVWKVGEPQRGDVVVFYNSDKTSESPKLIKRIIALEGDTVETRMTDGKFVFYVNGEAVEDEYASGENYYEQPLVTVPEGMFYYLGDNRTVSHDSRSGLWGNVKDVIGTVLFRIRTEGEFSLGAVT